jgi:hypothetical protein
MAQWLRRNYRHWLWSGNVLLVLDDVLPFTPGRIDWLLHYAGQCTPRTDAEVLLQNGAAQARVSILHPSVTHREEIGLAEHNPNEKIPYLIFNSKTPALQQYVIAAICLDLSAPPKLELLESDSYLGVRVTSPEYVEETYLNLNSKSGATGTAVILGEWETDASLVQLRWNMHGHALERCFVSDGSYLRQRGNSVMESLSKRCLCWSPANPAKVFSDRRSEALPIHITNTS